MLVLVEHHLLKLLSARSPGSARPPLRVGLKIVAIREFVQPPGQSPGDIVKTVGWVPSPRVKLAVVTKSGPEGWLHLRLHEVLKQFTVPANDYD